MKKKDFLNLLEEILEVDENTLTGEEELESLDNWNSLSMISLIAMVDENFDVTLEPTKIAESTTIQDIVDMVGDRIEK